MYNFSMFQNTPMTKPNLKMKSQKAAKKNLQRDLELSPWENNQANQYLSGQIQIQCQIRSKEVNNESKMSNKPNSKRSASQNYNKNGNKFFSNQDSIVPYIDKFQQILMQRCRSSTLSKKKSIIKSQNQQEDSYEAQKNFFGQKQNNQKVSYNLQAKNQNFSPQNDSKMFRSCQLKQNGLRKVLNTTYLTFYDEPSFTPFERNKKKINHIKKNFYTLETQTKETKKESISFKNFENFIKMKKFQKFHTLNKQNQETSLFEPQVQNFFSLSPKKNNHQTQPILQTQNIKVPQMTNDYSPKPIGKLFEITQIPKEKFGLYLKTQQIQTKNIKKQQVNLFKLQKESQCLLRMKSEPNSPIKNRNQRFHTTQTVINEKCQQSLNDWQPQRLKKMVSTNIQKIKKNIKVLKNHQHYKIVDKKMLQILGGKYEKQKQK